VADPGSDQRDIRGRLASARTPEEAAQILGRRRLIAYPIAFGVVAVICLGAIAYMVVGAATGERSAWTLLALPAPLFLVLYCGTIAIGGAYYLATGQRWPQGNALGRIFGRLNSNI
jgi:hypothetical protein